MFSLHMPDIPFYSIDVDVPRHSAVSVFPTTNPSLLDVTSQPTTKVALSLHYKSSLLKGG